MSIAPSLSSSTFAYVEERDSFFDLFPHRFDYIYADHPAPGQSPQWQTERRYPLSDRLLTQGTSLYGVRFGSKTSYCMLDIDSGSVYHPRQDRLAIPRLLAALEPIGLVSPLTCTSSYSGGLHLFFPFRHPIASWELAIAVSTLLENDGFRLVPGQLEVFPNPKPYSADGKPSLFNAHRLPLQAGSYVLNSDLQPIWSDRHQFVQQWRLLQDRNEIDTILLRQVLRQAQRRHYRVSGKANQFLNDLNAEIELGWTGHGQTNRLLGRIALRTYVFHHVLSGGLPLSGSALVEAIVQVAQSLPGYFDWCRHQHEIELRAEEWARCVESSHYFPYGSQKGKYRSKNSKSASLNFLGELPENASESSANQPSWNQRQSEAARDRIRRAIATLLNQNHLPVGATDRFRLLTQFGIGGTSLYRHRDLWHPDYLALSTPETDAVSESQPVENPPDPPASLKAEGEDIDRGESSPSPTSLFSTVGRNSLLHHAFRPSQPQPTFSTGRNLESSLGSLLSDRPTPPPAVSTDLPAVAPVCSVMDSSDLSEPPLILNLKNDLEDDPDLKDGPEGEEAGEWEDCSDLLAAIAVQIRCLSWTPEQVSDRLLSLFGTSKRSLLSPQELVQWWLYLQTFSQ